jgi:predicted kinase
MKSQLVGVEDRSTAISRRSLDRQRLFVLCGLPFSGKSTLARAMTDRLDVVNVEVDRVHAERNRDLSARPLTRDDWIAAYRISFKRLKETLRQGRSAVFDATSYRRIQRQRLRRIADAHGVPMTVIYLDVSAEEAKQRLEANRRQPRRMAVPSADFAAVVSEFQPPGDDEDVVRYDASLPADAWIETVLAPYVMAGVVA